MFEHIEYECCPSLDIFALEFGDNLDLHFERVDRLDEKGGNCAWGTPDEEVQKRLFIFFVLSVLHLSLSTIYYYTKY